MRFQMLISSFVISAFSQTLTEEIYITEVLIWIPKGERAMEFFRGPKIYAVLPLLSHSLIMSAEYSMHNMPHALGLLSFFPSVKFSSSFA